MAENGLRDPMQRYAYALDVPPTKIPRENTLAEEVFDLLSLLPLEEYELSAYVFATFAPNARRIIAMTKDYQSPIANPNQGDISHARS